MLTLVVGGVVGGVVTGVDEPAVFGVEPGGVGDEPSVVVGGEPGVDGDLLGVNVVGEGGEIEGVAPVRILIKSTIIISHILKRYKMNRTLDLID